MISLWNKKRLIHDFIGGCPLVVLGVILLSSQSVIADTFQFVTVDDETNLEPVCTKDLVQKQYEEVGELILGFLKTQPDLVSIDEYSAEIGKTGVTRDVVWRIGADPKIESKCDEYFIAPMKIHFKLRFKTTKRVFEYKKNGFRVTNPEDGTSEAVHGKVTFSQE